MDNLNYSIRSFLLLIIITIINVKWRVLGSEQYHIQTDEGPERYFRYQTDNGQYRKEKRLEDGTVIGTDAWIDSLGYMRQNDYIADNQGYRILKSITVFVGKNQPIQDAIKYAKKYKTTTGGLDKLSISNYHKKPFISQHTLTVPTTFAPPTQDNPLGYDHYRTPVIYKQPYVEPLSSYLPLNSVGSSTSSPDIDNRPIYSDFIQKIDNKSTFAKFNLNSHERPFYDASKSTPTTVKPYAQPIYSRNNYPLRYKNEFNPHQYFSKNNIENGNEYDQQYSRDNAVTSKGFRYFLPRQYHEEKNSDNDRRTGSFGYIDPFGIRRVVYYKASPSEGFVHRKNNRYVGFNATPYDPIT